MENLQIIKANALEAYQKADKKTKEILEALLPEIKTSIKPNKAMKITDRVKTFEDACNVLNIEEADILNGNETQDETAYIKLKTIARALNEGWKPNWQNSSEYKYYPLFYMDQPGSGFSFDDYVYDYAASCLGSRLCFKSRELAEYAGKQFTGIYRDFLTL